MSLLPVAAFACEATPAPAPTRIDDNHKVFSKPRRPAPTAKRLPSPNRDAPEGREGTQLPKDELETLLAEVAGHLAADRKPEAQVALRRCANKTPASIRCDGELGLILATTGQHKAESRYYLLEAGRVDDPEAAPELYDRVAGRLRRLGAYEECAAAQQIAIDREATAARHLARSVCLQSVRARLPEAVAELETAFALDPAPGTMIDLATILTQIPGKKDEGVTRLKKYAKEIKGNDPAIDALLTERIGAISGL